MISFYILLFLSSLSYTYTQIYYSYTTLSYTLHHFNYSGYEDYIWTFVAPYNYYNGYWNITFTYFNLSPYYGRINVYDGYDYNCILLKSLSNFNSLPLQIFGSSDRFISIQFSNSYEYFSKYGFSFIASYNNYYIRPAYNITSPQKILINSSVGIYAIAPPIYYNYWTLSITKAIFGSSLDVFSIYYYNADSFSYRYLLSPITNLTNGPLYLYSVNFPIYISYEKKNNNNPNPNFELNWLRPNTSCVLQSYSNITFSIRPYQYLCWNFGKPPTNYYWYIKIAGTFFNGDYFYLYYSYCSSNCSVYAYDSFSMSYIFGYYQTTPYLTNQNILISVNLLYKQPGPTYAPYSPPSSPVSSDNFTALSTILISILAVVLFLSIFLCLYLYSNPVSCCKKNDHENENDNLEILLPPPPPPLQSSLLLKQPILSNIKFDAPVITNNYIYMNDIIIEEHNAPTLDILNYDRMDDIYD